MMSSNAFQRIDSLWPSVVASVSSDILGIIVLIGIWALAIFLLCSASLRVGNTKVLLKVFIFFLVSFGMLFFPAQVLEIQNPTAKVWVFSVSLFLEMPLPCFTPFGSAPDPKRHRRLRFVQIIKPLKTLNPSEESK